MARKRVEVNSSSSKVLSERPVMMEKHRYRIARLNVEMTTCYETTLRQSEAYRSEFDGEPDVIVPAVTEERIAAIRETNPLLSPNLCEYILTGDCFYRKLLRYDGMMLHASAVAYREGAYLFSAPCGTGKSTHARIWRRVFGAENTRIVNDDKPVLRLLEGRFFVCGTPWSGKSRYHENICVPLVAVALLERSDVNFIEPAEEIEAVRFLLEQTVRPLRQQSTEALLFLLDRLLATTPIYRFGLLPDDDAARLAYETMRSKTPS